MSYTKTSSSGTISYHKDAACTILHREDGPAIEWADGSCNWMLDGKLHRAGGPAVVSGDFLQAWYQHGQLHRTDGGPAVEFTAVQWNPYAGDRCWYIDGELHREGAPAIENRDGSYMWYHHGRKHRLNGPAVRTSKGQLQWWVDGKRTTEKQVKAIANALKTTTRDYMILQQLKALELKLVKMTNEELAYTLAVKMVRENV